MKSIIKITIAVAALMIGGSSVAQVTRSGYFVDDYTYRYQINPAFGNSKNYIAIPAVGNFNVGICGNLNLDNILYPINGRTTTFMNPLVDTQEFLGNLEDINKLRTDIKIDLLSAGFKAFGGYNTVNISARTNVGVDLPKSIFSLLKEGLANKTYEIGDIRANASAYAEIALGHSRQLSSEWRVGATVKFLFGAGNVEADLRRADLALGEDVWNITTDAEINASLKGLTYQHNHDDPNNPYIDGIDVDGAGLGGFGMGIDLGVAYTPSILSDLTVSASITDLGFINWNNNMLASTNGEHSFTTDKYSFSVDDQAPNSFENEWERMSDDLETLYQLYDMGDQGSRSTSLATTFNIGVEYKLPVYRNLSFGLLNTTRINGDYGWTDFLLSANIAPVKCFDASANVSVGTFGCGFGWLMNLHLTGFNLFVGMDHTLGKVTPQFVPLHSNASANFGMNILF